MKSLPAEILAHIDDRRYAAVHLLAILDGASDLFWTDAPFPVTYGPVVDTTLATTGTGAVIHSSTSAGRETGTDNSWGVGAVMSTEGYVRGAFLSFKANQTTHTLAVGMNADPSTDSNFTSIDYAWYCATDGRLFIMESGVDKGQFGTYTTSTVLTIVYDGTNIRYLKDGVVQRTVARTIGAALYLDSAFFRTKAGAQISAMAFYPLETYVQQWFSVGDVVIDDTGNQTVSLAFPDVGKIVRGLLLNEDWSYRPAALLEVWLEVDASGRVMFDANGVPTVLNAHIIADGRADGGTANFEEATEPVTISIVPDTEAEGATGPAQEYEGSCRYVRAFKGIQCGYAGAETTCDGTFARCTALSNTTRYGGFRFAPKPGSTISVGVGSTKVGTR